MFGKLKLQLTVKLLVKYDRGIVMAVNVLEFLENSTQNNGAKTACQDEEESYSYDELSDYAKRIGSALIEVTNVRRPVPVLMDKGCKALAAFMGAVYAGCFYTMLDPTYPVVRLQTILDTLEAGLIIAT